VTSGLFDDPIQVGRYTLYQISLIVKGKHARNRREDMYNGNIIAMLYNINRGKGVDPITWKDVYPDEIVEIREQSVDEMQEIAKAITKALGGKITECR
jgi:hypothetical protein